MITIYKINLSEIERFGNTPKVEAKCDMMCFGFKKFDQEFLKFYEPTYEVDTDSIDHAFEATNLWEGYDVKRLKAGTGSSSVGDIFVKDGDCYFCDNYGWVAMGKYEGFK